MYINIMMYTHRHRACYPLVAAAAFTRNQQKGKIKTSKKKALRLLASLEKMRDMINLMLGKEAR